MKIELTLVRLKRTREPVAVYEIVNDIVELGNKVDTITSPSECEYLDCEINIPFSMICAGQFPDFATNEESQFEAIESMYMGEDWCSELQSFFTDNSSLWVEMPVGFDYLGINRKFEDRFFESEIAREDIF